MQKRAIALKVLREVLLTSADQVDERGRTNLGGVLVDNLVTPEARKLMPGEANDDLKNRAVGACGERQVRHGQQ